MLMNMKVSLVFLLTLRCALTFRWQQTHKLYVQYSYPLKLQQSRKGLIWAMYKTHKQGLLKPLDGSSLINEVHCVVTL